MDCKENKNIFNVIKDQIVSNAFSFILETIIMVTIAAFAISEIKQTRDDFKEKLDHSYTSLSKFSKLQAKKIDALTNQISNLNKVLDETFGVALKDVKENKEEYYKNLKDKSKDIFNKWRSSKKLSTE